MIIFWDTQACIAFEDALLPFLVESGGNMLPCQCTQCQILNIVNNAFCSFHSPLEHTYTIATRVAVIRLNESSKKASWNLYETVKGIYFEKVCVHKIKLECHILQGIQPIIEQMGLELRLETGSVFKE